MVDPLWMDIRHSIRRLLRSPGVSLMVVATLALVIGANTAVVSLLNAAVLRKVDVPNPDRLVAISVTDTRTGRAGLIYREAFDAFRGGQRSFSAVSMYSGGGYFRVEIDGTAYDTGYEGVMSDYFGLVGARLTAGRFLTEQDNDITAVSAPAVVIGDPRGGRGSLRQHARTPVRERCPGAQASGHLYAALAESRAARHPI